MDRIDLHIHGAACRKIILFRIRGIIVPAQEQYIPDGSSRLSRGNDTFRTCGCVVQRFAPVQGQIENWLNKLLSQSS